MKHLRTPFVPARLFTFISLFFLAAMFAPAALAQSANKEGNPLADPQAVVTAGHARFTVLTPQLVRMEWSEDGKFEDRASLVFLNRRLPAPAIKKSSAAGWTTIDTGKLRLRYQAAGKGAKAGAAGRFTGQNLKIEFTLNGKKVEWHPGMPDTGNLKGTTRTLDGVRGTTELEPGLLSRDGWVLVDDSQRPLFDSSDWPWVTAREKKDAQDWYFFGYGHDYKTALADFTRVAGKIPLPPRFAFGAWWSRYWNYTDQEFQQLVEDFEDHNVPLDVLVIDMDWHATFAVKWWEKKKDQAGQTPGWTGYTWSKAYFPDPPGFLAWTDRHGLKTPLNLHPASGVQPHEAAYPEMARAMGIDPATQKYVPFDIADKKFAQNYMDILHHPLEKQGVDFWWLDWQQQHKTSLEGVTPTWWLNYVHTSDMERHGKRPIIFHRWGGLGNHRYQIGFSGDTVSVWESLDFQPYFTATAANVGYGYWSHDIGGHMPGAVSPELYARWIQFGIFSPILRTHTTKNPESERRIWGYPVDDYRVMRDAFVLRYSMIPYIYTMSREAYDSGVSLLRPMYYDHPESAEAYDARGEYMFGDSLLVAPVTAPADEATGQAKKEVWLPEGEWFEWSSGTRLHGPAKLTRSLTLEEMPVYARAGAIIPMQPEMQHTGAKPVDPLILTIFPGAEGEIKIYEDQGDSLGYMKDEFARTPVKQSTSADGLTVIEVAAPEGKYPGMLTERGCEIRLLGAWPPESVKVNGQALAFVRSGDRTSTVEGWHYDGNHSTTIIHVARRGVNEPLRVEVKADAAAAQKLDGFPARMSRLWKALLTMDNSWPKGSPPDSLVEAAQTGNRISIDPSHAAEELKKLDELLPKVAAEIKETGADPKSLERAQMWLAGAAAAGPK